VEGLGNDPIDLPIVRAVMSLGRTLGLEVVAEGVENQAQLELLRSFGCDYAQGFFFSRALEPDATRNLLSIARRW
jgi:EAL domain-containing protein (putative c-di-GMP-specific phosphodiesterase class I)